MQKKYLSFLLLILSGYLPAAGQSVSNSGFEDWSVVQYFEDPDEYTTTNTAAYFRGNDPNVTRTPDAHSGSYALRLETINTVEGILEGAAFIGNPGDGVFSGGIPYTQRPDSLTGYVKYAVNPTDTAYVAAIFKKFGVPIGVTFAQFNGVQNDYQYFSVPIEWLVQIISPDTVAIALISSSIFTEPVAGSLLIVDQVQFVGPGAPFPNGDFENWTNYSSDEPDHWQSTNIFSMPVSSISVTKTTDSHSGNFAAKIENNLTTFNDTLAFITNGTIGEDGPIGGMAVEDIPEKLSGYYKYTPVGPDSALASLTLYRYNATSGIRETLDKTTKKLPEASSYTYFEIPVDYYSLPEPDTVNIAFGSGNFDESGTYTGLGSILFIDDLEITFKPHIVGVKDYPKTKGFEVFPNPATETVTFHSETCLNKEGEVFIYSSEGHLITKEECGVTASFSIQTGHFPAGVYLYRIKAGGKIFQGKFMVE